MNPVDDGTNIAEPVRGLKKMLYGIGTLFIALCSGIGLVPSVRQELVHFVERQFMHRSLNMNYWTQQLFALAFLVFIVNLLLYFVVATARGRKLFLGLAAEIKGLFFSIRSDWKALLVLFGIYAVGMVAIFRANYYYGGADDLYRAMSGSRGWRNFYRYISQFLSVFIHTSPKIFDIAPLTQLFALFIMALAALLLVRLFVFSWAASGPEAGKPADSPFSPLIYLASIPVCLFPYFLENLSYRYDAPYMALSVLFCILPFLFYRKQSSFAIMSVLCLFLMCLSYQAASGVYIVVCAFLVFKMWIQKEKDLKELFCFILTAIVCYALTLAVFFALFNVQPTGGSYVDKNAYAGAFPTNAKAYLLQIWDDFGWSTMKIAFLLLALLFVVIACQKSKRGRLPTFLVALLLLAFSTLFSYGAFLVMGKPLLEPRSMFPFGIVVSLVALCVAGWVLRDGSRPLVFLGRFCVFVLAYSTVIFAFAYGNAQNSQKKYTDFRMTLLLEDLSRIVPAEQDDIHIHILSDIDNTLIVKNLAHSYPLTTRMLEKLGGHAVIFYLQDFGFGVQAETDKYSEWDLAMVDYPLLADTRYHYIRGEGNVYYIYFKTPDITLRE